VKRIGTLCYRGEPYAPGGGAFLIDICPVFFFNSPYNPLKLHYIYIMKAAEPGRGGDI